MAEIVNLRRARKAKVRAGHEAEASQNRAKFGRSKAEKDRETRQAEAAARKLDGHKREP